jgi:hypothetical protein
MAVLSRDKLARVLGDTKVNRRLDAWLWFYLNRDGGGFALSEFDGPIMRDRMADFISSNPYIHESIDAAKTKFLLPDEFFTWIKEDRQIKWLIPQLRMLSNVGTAEYFQLKPPRLKGRALLIAMVDIWTVDITEKERALEYLKSAWTEHKKQDQIFRWFRDEESALRCAHALNWLWKNEATFTQDNPQIESYDDLLKFFDQTPFSKDEKLLRIEFIKKSWSQRKYREKVVGKKQYNFLLSDKVISQLDVLAETHNLKRPKILEILIEMEADKGIYISERLKKTRDLWFFWRGNSVGMIAKRYSSETASQRCHFKTYRPTWGRRAYGAVTS